MSNIFRNPQQNDQPAPKRFKTSTGVGSGRTIAMTGAQNGGKVMNGNSGKGNIPKPDVARPPKIGGRNK